MSVMQKDSEKQTRLEAINECARVAEKYIVARTMSDAVFSCECGDEIRTLAKKECYGKD